MATIVNNPGGGDNNSAAGWIVAAVVIVLVVLGFIFLMPHAASTTPTDTTGTDNTGTPTDTSGNPGGVINNTTINATTTVTGGLGSSTPTPQ